MGKASSEFFYFFQKLSKSFLFYKIFNYIWVIKIVTVEPCGASGGLELFYNNDFNFSIVLANNRIIDVEAIINGNKVFISFIYGDPVPKRWKYAWERLTRMVITRFDPWMIIGDLNKITGNHEKKGGTMRNANTFQSFNTMILNCGMLEFPCLGHKLSYKGRRSSKTIWCRLDRALANEDWHAIFTHSLVEYLAIIVSDHRPIRHYR